MRKTLIALAVGLATMCWISGTARAQTGPSFPCPSMRDPLAQLICSSPDLSQADLRFVQAYQALRAQLDPSGQSKLRQEGVAFNQAVRSQCGIGAPDSGKTASPTAIPCVLQRYLAQRDLLANRLTGAAAEEAARPLQAHLALQADLKRLGLLPPDATVDGVFGPATRTAIQQWQHSRGLSLTGFLGNSDGALLQQQAASLPAQATGTPTASSPAAPPPTTGQNPAKQATAPQGTNPPQDHASVSSNPLDGWDKLKFGMTHEQACAAMNTAGMTCTIENQEMFLEDARVRVGATTWSVDLFFVTPWGIPLGGFFKLLTPQGLAMSTTLTDGDSGNLKGITLRLCDPRDPTKCGGNIRPCEPESYIGPLEQRYGTFSRNPPGTDVDAVKRFANGAEIHVSFFAHGDVCNLVRVEYLNPNINRPPPPKPAAASGHF